MVSSLYRLINIPATFQKRINSVLGECLNEFIIVYLNNIIIVRNKGKWPLFRVS